MHSRPLSFAYVLLAALLFCWTSLPGNVSDELRSFSVASFAPLWHGVKKVRNYLSDRPGSFWNSKKEYESVRLSQLQLENSLLREQIKKLSRWLSADERLEKLLALAKRIEEQSFQAKDGDRRSFLDKRLKYLLSILQSEFLAVPAQVIYRDPSCWSSSLWINVGDEDNAMLGKSVIAKNSPVVIGSALIGVVDYVGKKQARVRLITDSALSPAVRAIRGESQNREFAYLIDELLLHLQTKNNYQNLTLELKELQKQLLSENGDKYLAKGELHGSGSPLWRNRSSLLKGVGFNFDYPDEEGSCPKGLPILERGDLLVTTGFDGVFPPDLRVGIVTNVSSLKPGGYVYGIDVRPIASDLSELETVFILPPRGGD